MVAGKRLNRYGTMTHLRQKLASGLLLLAEKLRPVDRFEIIKNLQERHIKKVSAESMKKNESPLEDFEQMAFVAWLVLHDIKHTAIPNNTYTTSWNQKLKNKRMGLNPGLCDIFLLISPEQSVDGEGYALFIEMKRSNGGVVSKEQEGWIDAINGLKQPYIQAYVARGADSAIKIVSHYLKSIKVSIF